MKTFQALILTLLVGHCSFGQNAIVQDILGNTDMARVESRILELCGYDSVMIDGQMELINSRHKFQPGNELSFKYLSEEIIAMGYDTFSHSFNSTGKNLLALKEGTLYPDSFYMICAHYDGMPPGIAGPAADDNASSVVAILEGMSLFSGHDFEYSLLFAFWDEEEQGLIGSEAYAQLAVDDSINILNVFNMDAIAHDSDDDYVARIHATPSIPTSAAYADSVLHYNNVFGIGLDMIKVIPGATYSDHASFWDENISANLLIEDWEGDPNPGYHTANDDTSYFNWPFYERMIKLCNGSIASWAKPIEPDTVSSLFSIDQILNPDIVTVSPNPASNRLQINSEFDEVHFYFYNAIGDVVKYKKLYKGFSALKVEDLPSGIYYYVAEHQGFKQRGDILVR